MVLISYCSTLLGVGTITNKGRMLNLTLTKLSWQNSRNEESRSTLSKSNYPSLSQQSSWELANLQWRKSSPKSIVNLWPLRYRLTVWNLLMPNPTNLSHSLSKLWIFTDGTNSSSSNCWSTSVAHVPGVPIASRLRRRACRRQAKTPSKMGSYNASRKLTCTARTK